MIQLGGNHGLNHCKNPLTKALLPKAKLNSKQNGFLIRLKHHGGGRAHGGFSNQDQEKNEQKKFGATNSVCISCYRVHCLMEFGWNIVPNSRSGVAHVVSIALFFIVSSLLLDPILHFPRIHFVLNLQHPLVQIMGLHHSFQIPQLWCQGGVPQTMIVVKFPSLNLLKFFALLKLPLLMPRLQSLFAPLAMDWDKPSRV